MCKNIGIKCLKVRLMKPGVTFPTNPSARGEQNVPLSKAVDLTSGQGLIADTHYTANTP